MSTMTVSDQSQVVSIGDLCRLVEKLRVLRRILEVDPSDVEARAAMDEILALGIDEDDVEYVLSIAPRRYLEDERPGELEATSAHASDKIAATSVGEQDGHEEDDRAWISRLLRTARSYRQVGLEDRALSLLQTALRLSPKDDRVRAELYALLASQDGGRDRGDETVPIRLAVPA